MMSGYFEILIVEKVMNNILRGIEIFWWKMFKTDDLFIEAILVAVWVKIQTNPDTMLAMRPSFSQL